MDQNILSELQSDNPLRQDFELILNKCRDAGGVFVFSQVHVDECRASDRPEEFVQILDSIGAYFLVNSMHDGSERLLEPGRARDLILCQEELSDGIAERFIDIIKPIHFALGGLGSLKEDQLLTEMADDLERNWNQIIIDVPAMFRPAFSAKKLEAINLIRTIPAQQYKVEMTSWKEEFRKKLPKNFAQLDEFRSEIVVEHLMGLIDEHDQLSFREAFPKEFLKTKGYSVGCLASLAFMLCALDLVRDRRTRTGELSKRHKHFLGQFRDCQHIEQAAFCDLFLTKDKGEARLARSVFSYAGVATKVGHLKTI